MNTNVMKLKAMKPNAINPIAIKHRIMHTKHMLLSILMLFSLIFLSSKSHADEDTSSSAAIGWGSLSAQQQETLAPIKDKWNDLPPERQQKLSKGADKWAAMNPEQREHVQERLNHFKNLSPEDKAQVKENMRKFRELPQKNVKLCVNAGKIWTQNKKNNLENE